MPHSTAPSDPAARRAPRPGDRLALVGAALFVVGAICAIATVIPLLAGLERLPRAVYLGSVLCPVGLGLGLIGLVRSSRVERRRKAQRSAARAAARHAG